MRFDGTIVMHEQHEHGGSGSGPNDTDGKSAILRIVVVWLILSIPVRYGLARLGYEPVGMGGLVFLWLFALAVVPCLMFAAFMTWVIWAEVYHSVTDRRPGLIWKVVGIVVALLAALFFLLPGGDYYGAMRGF